MYVTSWEADVDFRATGPERGGGNLNIWLAKDGSKQVSMGSIYTVGKFDGLVLVVDMHAGSGGMIRGFLNDGTTDYKQRQVDELAFGHCLYSYRNRGGPSQLKIKQSGDNFRVEIDQQVCFESNKINIPASYNWGITAATPDNPDSFEIFKFTVMENSGGMRRNSEQPQDKAGQRVMDNAGGKTQNIPTTGDDDFDQNIIPDEDAGYYTSSSTQFEDLHRRLQGMNHQISSIYRGMIRYEQAQDKRHTDIKMLVTDVQSKMGMARGDIEKLGATGSTGGSSGSGDDMLNRIRDLEKEVRAMRNDINKKIAASDKNFKTYLEGHHAALSDAVSGTPGHAKLILLLIGSQAVLVVGYVLYVRRRMNIPKKYL